MFKCYECGEVFDNPEEWVERHGEILSFNEKMAGCPSCHEMGFDEAFQCLRCGEWFSEDELIAGFCEDCGASVEKDMKYILQSNLTPEEIEYLREMQII